MYMHWASVVGALSVFVIYVFDLQFLFRFGFEPAI